MEISSPKALASGEFFSEDSKIILNIEQTVLLKLLSSDHSHSKYKLSVHPGYGIHILIVVGEFWLKRAPSIYIGASRTRTNIK